ncbi:hypothetical protein BDK51DRAFT_45506 [Blyttiomyces helicus]|uniref:MYND-type domain-containing protein n=1 Tax=Blyttiomyces helicus TaxID=388810 RepID=A0A4V1IRX8_9FUNG|nr:hypothetical protein BDK51DRAFT_45506 [Blyttiomyces helicus]|eukprot:RKO91607.1 hypothetical protein BDK51DRAFT_45506 [Blyttiomyces helicus]
MTQFTQLLETKRSWAAAVHFAQRGDWRASADTYQRAIEGMPGFAQRYFCLQAYTSIIRQRQIPVPTADDLAFMRGIIKGDTEPILHRAHCAHQALSSRDLLAESVTAADRRTIVMMRLDNKDHKTRAGEHVDETLGVARANLAIIEQRTEPGLDLPATCTVGHFTFNVPLGTMASGSIEQQARLKDAIIGRCYRVSRSGCDACGASAESDQLKKCGRSKRVAYYSKDCRQGAWFQHRPSYRAPGASVAGDLVHIAGLTSAAHQHCHDSIVEIQGTGAEPHGPLASGDPWRRAWDQ